MLTDYSFCGLLSLQIGKNVFAKTGLLSCQRNLLNFHYSNYSVCFWTWVF